MQLNQVMDLDKVLYEPEAALPAAPDPCLYFTECCLLFRNSNRPFDLTLFHIENLDRLTQHALNALIELAGKVKHGDTRVCNSNK